MQQVLVGAEKLPKGYESMGSRSPFLSMKSTNRAYNPFLHVLGVAFLRLCYFCLLPSLFLINMPQLQSVIDDSVDDF